MTAGFGVVGVTGGSAWTTNPCLAAEAARFPAALHLYVNTGWNAASPHATATSPPRCAKGDAVCRAYDYGYGAGRSALGVAAAARVHARTWWLDVESGNTWNAVPAQNRASLQGEYDALPKGGVAVVGAYGTTAQWNGLTGRWRTGWPSWGATVLRSASRAATYCTGHRFTGGQTFRGATFDEDIACAVGTVPSAPRSVVVTFPAAHVVQASWAVPASRGSAAVTAYQVRWTADAGRHWTAWASTRLVRAVTHRGLVKGHTYTTQVRAVDLFGVGPVGARRFVQGR
jgi:hypothetical protein